MNENWCVFCIAILKGMTVEQAFGLWEDNKDNRDTYTAEDVKDMAEMRKTMTYKAIGEMYGISDTAVFRRLKGYKKDRSTAMKTVTV